MAIKKGVDINDADMGFFWGAVRDRKIDQIKYLVSKKADMYISHNYQGSSPFYAAVRYANFEVCSLLVDAGIDIDNSGSLMSASASTIKASVAGVKVINSGSPGPAPTRVSFALGFIF